MSHDFALQGFIRRKDVKRMRSIDENENKERRRQKWIREEEIKWNEIALKESKKKLF